MPYVDGFVLAVPKASLEAYKEMARVGGEVWMDHGALSYVECIGDDVPMGELTSFPRAVQAKDDEVVVFSWITYESRAKRDEVNAKVMADPRLTASRASSRARARWARVEPGFAPKTRSKSKRASLFIRFRWLHLNRTGSSRTGADAIPMLRNGVALPRFMLALSA